MLRTRIPLTLIDLAASAAAQNLTVSPVAFAATEGNSSLSYIFTTAPINTQQVHGDLRGTTRVMTALSFRRDGVSTASTGLPRTIDMQIWAGDANFANVGINYAANFVNPPVNVFTRKLVSTPNWRSLVSTPSPFDFTLPFDTPFVSIGMDDFAWQMLCHSNNGGSSDTVRVDLASPAFTNSPTPGYGTACRATGTTQDYQLLGTMGTNINPEFRWSIQGFPTLPSCQLNILLLGFSDPAPTIPGLCNTLHCSAEISLAMPASDSNGTWTYPLYYMPYQPALVGASFHEQAYSADPGQGGFGLVGTVARRLTFMQAPATGTAAMIKSVRNTSSLATTATEGQSISDGGFVIQITH